MDYARSWWALLIEGIVAILLGLYLLMGGDRAAGNFALVAGLYILVVSLVELFRGSGKVSRYRGIVGVIVSLLILLLYFVDILPTYWDFTIFAVGAIIVGIFGLYAAFFARSGREFAWGPVLVNGLLLLWGIMIFFTRSQDRDMQAISGWILIAMGAIIALWGFLARNGDDSGEDTSAPDPIEKAAPATDSPKDDTEESS